MRFCLPVAWDHGGVDFTVVEADEPGGRPEIMWKPHFEAVPPMEVLQQMLIDEAHGQLEEYLGLTRSQVAITFGQGGQEFVWFPPIDGSVSRAGSPGMRCFHRTSEVRGHGDRHQRVRELHGPIVLILDVEDGALADYEGKLQRESGPVVVACFQSK